MLPDYPDSHLLGMRVPAGGSSCARCSHVSADGRQCDEKHFREWNEGSELPEEPHLYCCDFFSPAPRANWLPAWQLATEKDSVKLREMEDIDASDAMAEKEKESKPYTGEEKRRHNYEGRRAFTEEEREEFRKDLERFRPYYEHMRASESCPHCGERHEQRKAENGEARKKRKYSIFDVPLIGD
jgi:hypothetical protein